MFLPKSYQWKSLDDPILLDSKQGEENCQTCRSMNHCKKHHASCVTQTNTLKINSNTQ